MSFTTLGTDYRLYNGHYYEVNTKKSGINQKILDRFLEQLAIMEERHNKLFIYIFILDIKTSKDTNKIMSDFNPKLERHFKKYQKVTDMGYQWVREKVNYKPEHYHQVIMLDGNKIQNNKHKYNSMLDIWKSVGGNHIHRPENPFYNYKRGDCKTMADIIYRVSYLAKNATKYNNPKQTKNYATSRIKPNI